MKTDVDSRAAPTRSSSMPPVGGSHGRRSVALAVGVIVAVAVALVGGGLWWLVLGGDPPPAATLDGALAGLHGVPATTATTAVAVDGTWSIDRTITNAEGSGSYTGFRIGEVLAGVGSATAVGRTSAVEGTVTVQGTTLTAARINANLAGITTDDSRRDAAVQAALDTSRFPNATFVLTAPADVGSVPAEGLRITVGVAGDLTIHGVTRPVTLDLQAQLQSGVLVVVGATDVALSDYGVTAPTAPVVAGVDDYAVVEVQLYLVRR